MIIDTDQIDHTIEGLERLIKGYIILIYGANALQVSQEAITELNEGVASKQLKVGALQRIVAAVKAADDEGAFDLDKETASQEVIDLLKTLSDDAALVTADFVSPQVTADSGSVVVG